MALLENLGIELHLGSINDQCRKSLTVWFEGFTEGKLVGFELDTGNPNAIDIQFLYYNFSFYNGRPPLDLADSDPVG